MSRDGKGILTINCDYHRLFGIVLVEKQDSRPATGPLPAVVGIQQLAVTLETLKVIVFQLYGGEICVHSLSFTQAIWLSVPGGGS